ncbi:MAG TPA: OmpH family outer membrane protein [Rhizomicrobium sp.]|jgi:Skp family chaperone for outer membrane proteins|nr:OmpH family outer membrane protein [Rhizomicrobium sp.]
MRKKSSASGFSAAAGALAFCALLAAPPALAATTPQPKIVVVDRAGIMRASKVGQDIVRQINAYTDSAEKELKAKGSSLRAEGQALQRQLAILAADVKSRKIKEFEARQSALQAEAQKRQSLIQGGFIKARQQVEQALGPILQGIMVERGANLMLDRNAVVLGAPGIDVTSLAVQRLNQKLPSVKVELVAPPPGFQQPPPQ